MATNRVPPNFGQEVHRSYLMKRGKDHLEQRFSKGRYEKMWNMWVATGPALLVGGRVWRKSRDGGSNMR